MLRIAIVSVVQGAVFTLIAAVNYFLGQPVAWAELLWALAIIQAGLVGGLFFCEYPSGVEWMAARLYLSTGMRFGVPLVAGLVIDYFLYPGLLRNTLPALIAMYAAGMFCCVWMSTRPVAESSLPGQRRG